jgi:hypothetical protein
MMKNVKISDEAHKALKVECAKTGQKISEYLSNLIVSSILGENCANTRNQNNRTSGKDRKR